MITEEALLSLVTAFGPGALLFFLIILAAVLYHRSVVESEARVVTNYLGEGGKLREILGNAKNVLISRAIFHAIEVYESRFKDWFQSTLTLDKLRQEDKFLKEILDRGRFRSLLKEGKIKIGEEDLESIGRIIDGVRFIDSLFETCSSAREIENKYSYKYFVLVLAVAFGILFSFYITDYFALFIIAVLGAVIYHSVFISKHIEDVRWARKHLINLEAKTNIEEVIKYVLKASSEEI